MAAQRDELLRAMVAGERVAIEAQWTGTLAVPFGTLAVGDQMRARFASALRHPLPYDANQRLLAGAGRRQPRERHDCTVGRRPHQEFGRVVDRDRCVERP